MKARVLFLFAGLLALLGSCTNKGQAPGGESLDIPKITTAVSGNGTSAIVASVHPMAIHGASLNSDCTTCGSGTSFQHVHSLASIFVIQGKIADMNSCMISAVSAYDIVPGITSGSFKYLRSDSSQMKVKVSVTDKVVSSFEIFNCDNGVQTQYVTGTNSNGNVTFKLRGGDSNFFVSMDATGQMSGTNWTSKSLNVGFYSSTMSQYSYSTVTQNQDYLDISGIIDTGTLGTLDGSDIRLVSRAQLIGSSIQDYALGDGSIRIASGVGAASNNNWNGDTAVHGSGPTTYDSAVASATLPSIPTSRVTSFTGAEQWDCSEAEASIDFAARASSNSGFMNAVMACQEAFQ